MVDRRRKQSETGSQVDDSGGSQFKYPLSVRLVIIYLVFIFCFSSCCWLGCACQSDNLRLSPSQRLPFQMQTTTCSSFLALLCGNRPSCDRHQRQVVRSIWSRQFSITPCASCPVLSLSLSLSLRPPRISHLFHLLRLLRPQLVYLCTYVSMYLLRLCNRIFRRHSLPRQHRH